MGKICHKKWHFAKKVFFYESKGLIETPTKFAIKSGILPKKWIFQKKIAYKDLGPNLPQKVAFFQKIAFCKQVA